MPTRSSRPSSPASRRPRAIADAAAPGARLRLALRPVQGRRLLRAARPGHAPRPRRHPPHGQRGRGGAPRARRVPPAARPRAAARRGRGRATSPPGSRTSREAQVGDTVTAVAKPATEPLPGYQEAKSLVFAGLYPLSGPDYPLLRDALEKLHLNDASFTYEPESSVALGFGFRCGFLGLLHMEIVQERLEREFNLDLIASAPSVEYRVQLTMNRGTVAVDNPARFPDVGEIESIEEPWVQARRRDAGPLHRLADGAHHGPARHVREHGVPRPAARPHALRAAARRADRRLLRPAQEPDPGLRVDGLRGDRLPRGQPREARRPRQRRARRRAEPDRPPRPRPGHRPRR